MTRPLLFVLCGPPFAGKSTLARAMAERFGMTRIEIDEVHRERTVSALDDADWRIAMQRSVRRLHEALGRGESVVWDSASLTRSQRQRIRAIGERYGAEMHLIHIATSDDERLRRRLENLERRARVDVPGAAFEAASNEFEIPGEDERPFRYEPDRPVDGWLEETIAPLLNAAEMKE